MDFIVGLIKVLAGTFVLFTLARMALLTIGARSMWTWVAIVGALALSNMIIYRLLGSTINPPFFTAVFFGVTLAGLSPKESEKIDPWIKRAIFAVVIGTAIGWASFITVGYVK